MKKHFLELAAEYPLWDGAASFAKNPIALLSVIFGIALMFTLIVVSSMGIANNGPSGLASNFSARRYDSHSLHCLLDGWRCARRISDVRAPSVCRPKLRGMPASQLLDWQESSGSAQEPRHASNQTDDSKSRNNPKMD